MHCTVVTFTSLDKMLKFCFSIKKIKLFKCLSRSVEYGTFLLYETLMLCGATIIYDFDHI